MKITILFIGLRETLKSSVRNLVKESQELVCTNVDQVKDLLNRQNEMSVDVVFIGTEISGISSAELGQFAKMIFPSQPLFFLSEDVKAFDRTQMKKNGYSEAFLLPIDKSALELEVGKALAGKEHEAYSAVRLIDIEPGTKLDFQVSVYLPANDKYIAYSAPGAVMEPSRLERLKKHQRNSVYVPVEQLQSFYDYSANRLKALAKGDGMSETERREKLRGSVRELFSGMLSESYSTSLSSGIKAANHTRNIVSQFILAHNPSDWYVRLMDQIGQQADTYSHTENVSTYAALFAVAAGVGQVEDVAIAGMFHDLGIAKLPPSIQDKRHDELSADEQTLYEKHPEYSVEVLQSRKMVVSDAVVKAIIHHHERWNGTGYPAKIDGRRISREGQIVAVADRFDYLTRVESKRVPLSPDQAILQIARENIADPQIINELIVLFARNTSAVA
jgi:HD-GYP domain-containing protein (c-di-GMP phosphodiesterase class II)